jgi:beta-glucosidase-like glycosyl hydrolase
MLFAVLVLLLANSPASDRLANEITGVTVGGASPGAAPSSGRTDPVRLARLDRCPWLQTAMEHHRSPAALAALVVRRMTLYEKLGEIDLIQTDIRENIDSGVSRLCIPPFTLQDGPQGLAFGSLNVTQLPAPVALGATFDTAMAHAYGRVLGSEALGQGIDVIQGPNLNIERIPEAGRSWESLGEDPVLVSAMGVGEIEGIQSTGAMAMAKHFAVYTQETNRSTLNDVVSQRALEEIYLPPFKAAVTQAHVSSIMCAYPEVNGTYQCQSAQLLGLLRTWGFTGFVRSDLGAVHDPVVALRAGTDLLKPLDVNQLAVLIQQHQLPVSVVDNAVTRVLTEMFAHGLVGGKASGLPGDPVDSTGHTDFALSSAERSAVLLKDTGSVLPLVGPRARSVAVIGADASTEPVTTGFGSSQVVPPFTSTPLTAIRGLAGAGASVTYSNGGSTTGNLPPIPSDLLTPATGVGHGLTLTLTRAGPGSAPRPVSTKRPVVATPPAVGASSGTATRSGGAARSGAAARSAAAAKSGAVVLSGDAVRSIRIIEPNINAEVSPNPATSQVLPPVTPSAPVDRLHAAHSAVTGPLDLGGAIITDRSRIELPPGWSNATAAWTGGLTPPRTGLYTLSLQGSGAVTLSLNGVPVVSDMVGLAHSLWSATVPLIANHHYRLSVNWDPFGAATTSGVPTGSVSQLTLGWSYVGGQIDAAVAAARKAGVAVVFVGDYEAEGSDRTSLSLPGDENDLISAVAAANPHTVVVLNTGGPSLMPWLGQVAGVVEAWYPGEEDGNAIAAILFGKVDPSGRLPITFPTTDGQSAIHTPTQWPGIDLSSSFTEGLDVGYRYDHAHHIQPLFPFGYGLSYTNFSLKGLNASRSQSGVTLEVKVTNTGTVAGTDVPQAYLTYPSSADEPPAQLVAFYPVTLPPGHSKTVSLFIASSAFQTYLNRGWTTVPGRYQLLVGQSSSNLPLSTSVPAP